MKDRIFSIITLVLGALLAIGVSTVFAACGPKEDGTWMHCHDAQMAVMALGVAIAVVSLVAMLLKSNGAKIGLGVVNAVLGLVVCLVPGTIVSMCMMETMRCHAVMKPFAMIMGALVLVFAIIGVVKAARDSRADAKPKMSL